MDTASTVQTSRKSEEFNFSHGNQNAPTVAAQRPPLLLITVASAITKANTARPIRIQDPSHTDTPLTKTVATKSKSFKHRKSIDATFC